MSQDKNIDLSLLLANEAGYKALLSYLEQQAKAAEDAYIAAACSAVFAPDARTGAMVQHGKRCAYDDMLRTVRALVKGNTEGK